MAQSNATQTFTCALTGQSPLTDPVVTPSGYVCSRKLLLTKLSENGGVDPFDAAGTRRLDESALIELSTSAGTNAGAAAPPRPPKATSLPSLLGMLQNEFDAVLLELYDTRKALEETRRELSSALYQNDAAVRVVARLVQERDEARMKLEEFLAAGVAPSAEPQKRGRDDEAGGDAPAKKAKTDEEATADEGPTDLTKIPESELSAMTKTWKTLSKSRKSIAKLKRSEEATNKNEKTLTDLADGSEKKVNLGKSSAKAGVLCIASFKSSSGAEYIVTGGHDKSAIVYNATTGQIAATLTGAGKDVTAVHGLAFEESMLIATGSADGYVRLYTVPLSGDGEPILLGSADLAKGTPVNVTVHPSSTVEEGRVLLASSEGIIELYKWSAQAESLKLLTQLGGSDEETKYSSGCMHPDGLIYIAGTAAGELIIWDLKTQAIAGTLKVCFGFLLLVCEKALLRTSHLSLPWTIYYTGTRWQCN